MKIVKNSGHSVDFDRGKLKKSLEKSGVASFIVNEVLESIENQVYEGIKTKQIYKLAFSLLKKASNSHAARYNLRSALQMLGSAGFFFEQFIAKLYASEGYDTKMNLTLIGKCVSHEIDIVLKKGEQITMVECKFHNSRETNSNVKVPMYILSRFNDVKVNSHNIFSKGNTISTCIIATNNRFSSDAISFAVCSGLELLSWNYPDKNNLKHKIDANGLYPVTCLTTLSKSEKEQLMNHGVIIVKELLNNELSLKEIGLSNNRTRNVLKEATTLCNYLQL